MRDRKGSLHENRQKVVLMIASEHNNGCGLNDTHFVHNRRLVVRVSLLLLHHVVISYALKLSSSEFYGSSQKLGMENEDEMWRGLEKAALLCKAVQAATTSLVGYLIIQRECNQAH